MKKICTFLIASIYFGSSNASPNETIASGKIAFTETSQTGEFVRKLTFELTGKNADACISGDWKQARAIDIRERYTKNPVYKIENGKIEILLINGICDSYNSYIGQLKDQVFHGRHVRYGLRFSETVGKVTGSYTHE